MQNNMGKQRNSSVYNSFKASICLTPCTILDFDSWRPELKFCLSCSAVHRLKQAKTITDSYCWVDCSESGDKIGKKLGVPSEFVKAIQEYFALQFSLSFGHPMFFGVPVPLFGLPFDT